MERELHWDDLTEEEKYAARRQYIYIRACEDEMLESEAEQIYDTSDATMQGMKYFVNTAGLWVCI